MTERGAESRSRWIIGAVVVPLVAAMIGAGIFHSELTCIFSDCGGSSTNGGPRDRCLRGAPADVDTWLTQPGNINNISYPTQNDPPNDIFPGNVLRVTVTGTVVVDPKGLQYGPSGNGVPATKGANLIEGVPEFGSATIFNHKGTGWVGGFFPTTDLAGCFDAPSVPVRMLFFINQSNISSNQGAWQFHIQIYR